jgi:aminotransferase
MGRKFLARRLDGLVQSDIRRMSRECERVGGINLGQGICDLPTPPLVARGATDAIAARRSSYSVFEGIPELRSAIATKLARDNGITADPDREIVVTVGATGAFAATINALLNPGDGVVLFEPYYGYHLNALLVGGFQPQFVPLEPPDFAFRVAALEQTLTPATRAVVVCTPGNPSGKMFSTAELDALAVVAARHDLLVITDEIYEHIVYDDHRHVSPAALSELRPRTVSIMGLSKTFSITGWRLGYAVAPPAMSAAIGLVNDLYYVCAPTPLQHGAAAGFAAPPAYFAELRAAFQRKRDMILEALGAAGFVPCVPQGAYYILADFSALGWSSAETAAMELLRRTKVAAVQGTSFFRGEAGNRMLRFCYAKEDQVLREACQRLRQL